MWCTNWQQYPGCIHSITPFPFIDRNFIILIIIIIIKLILLVSLPSLPILFFFYCSQHVHLFLLLLCRNKGFESWIWLAQVSFLSFALGFQRWILFSDIISMVVYQTQNLMSFWLGKHLPKMSADQTNADTAGIVNKLSPEPPVNHWRHMGAIAWTKLISNLHSARTIWYSSIWIDWLRLLWQLR